GQAAHVEAGAAQPQLLGAPPGEAQVPVRPQPLPGHLQRDLQEGGRAGAVVVDAGASGHAVEVGADHEHVAGVAAGPVGDEVVAGGAVAGERLECGGVPGGVQQVLDVVGGGQVAGPAVRPVAAVGGGDGLQPAQVGLHVLQRDVGDGRGCGEHQRDGEHGG